MGRGKLRRTLIPLEVINRYSVIEKAGDLINLERTGYVKAMLESGFMQPDTVKIIREAYSAIENFDVSKLNIRVIQEYDLFGYDYQIPENLQVEGWQALIRRIDRYLTISEIGTISCPIAGIRIAENTRKSTEKDLIQLVKDKHLEFRGGFPEGVYSWDALRNATHKILCTLTIMFQDYVNAIEKGYLPEKHKDYAEIWRNHYKRNTLNANAKQKPEPLTPQKKSAYTLEKEKERRAIYRKVEDEMGVSTKKSVLDEAAAKRAGCTARMIRAALKADQ